MNTAVLVAFWMGEVVVGWMNVVGKPLEAEADLEKITELSGYAVPVAKELLSGKDVLVGKELLSGKDVPVANAVPFPEKKIELEAKAVAFPEK